MLLYCEPKCFLLCMKNRSVMDTKRTGRQGPDLIDAGSFDSLDQGKGESCIETV